MLLERITHTLCDSLLEPYAREGDGRLAPPYADVARFVLNQRSKAAGFLALPLAVATVCFDLSGIVRRGRPFCLMSSGERALQIQNWRRSRFAPFRDLIRFYESLSVLGLFSREER